MKIFLIVEDDSTAPGGVSLSIMVQQTTQEAQDGLGMYYTPAGQCALAARDRIEECRRNAKRLAEQAIATKPASRKALSSRVEYKRRPWKCLH